jgi:hypothetical protein
MVQALTRDEYATESIKLQITDFDNSIRTSLGEAFSQAEDHAANPYLQDVDDGVYEPIEPEAEMPEMDAFDIDSYLMAEVQLPKNDGWKTATVLRCKHDANGNPIGIANRNPLLDSRVFEVQFQDGHIEEYAANTIAENLYSQVDDDGYHHRLFDQLIDHRKTADAMSIEDMYTTSHNGNRSKNRTTKGWEICVRWIDGSTSWEALRNIKESHPVELAEYAMAQHIANEPAFAWWVFHTLKRRDRIISAVTARYKKRTHTFGIEVPTSVKHALEIDRRTRTDFWIKAIQKEMRNVGIAFEFLTPGTTIPIGYKWIPLNMIFDVKMDFSRKARLVAGGHKTDPPSSMTYSSVVSRDSIRIAFLLAALNDLEVLAADIGNAYLNAPTREKVYSTAGKEFGSRAGETVIIVRALYGLKSSGAAWRAHLASSLMSLGYTSCLADPDVWYRSATKADGTNYYEYLLVYVDDTLVISHEPHVTMAALSELYRMKEGSIGKPTKYLGADVIEYRLPTDHQRPKWGFSSQQYVTEAIRNVEMELAKLDQSLINNATTPFTSGYRPELDLSPLLDDQDTNWFQNLIGILRWSVELGRIDIHIEVAMLASFLVQPHEGHLDQCLHIFAYLKKHKKSTMVFDDNLPNIDESRLHKADWSTFCNYAKESLPPNAPEPRGQPVDMYAFVDADHAGDKIT